MFHFSLASSDSKAKAREYCASFYNGEPVLSVSSNTFGEVPVFFGAANKGQRFDCVEIDRTTFLSGLRPYNELKKQYPTLTYQNKDVFDMDFSQYKRINLDFCGNLNNALMFNLFKHLKDFNGKVFITLLRGREQFDVSHYGAKSNAHFRDVIFPQMIKTFTGLDVYLPRHDYENYKEGSSKASHMMIYSFIRNEKDVKAREHNKRNSDNIDAIYNYIDTHETYCVMDVVKATGIDKETVEHYFKKYQL